MLAIEDHEVESSRRERADELRQWGVDPALGRSLMDGLRDAYHVAAFDYENHVLAMPKPDTLTPANIVSDILAVADALGGHAKVVAGGGQNEHAATTASPGPAARRGRWRSRRSSGRWLSPCSRRNRTTSSGCWRSRRSWTRRSSAATRSASTRWIDVSTSASSASASASSSNSSGS